MHAYVSRALWLKQRASRGRACRGRAGGRTFVQQVAHKLVVGNTLGKVGLGNQLVRLVKQVKVQIVAREQVQQHRLLSARWTKEQAHAQPHAPTRTYPLTTDATSHSRQQQAQRQHTKSHTWPCSSCRRQAVRWASCSVLGGPETAHTHKSTRTHTHAHTRAHTHTRARTHTHNH